VRDIRSITIDLDDTLWAIHPVIIRAERRLRSWLADHYPRTVERFSIAAVQELRNEVEIEHAEHAHDLTHMRREVLRRMSEAAGYGAALVNDAFDVFDAARNEVSLFPEVIPALKSLREDYVLIAVTNGNANLEKIGISELFDHVVTAISAGSAKPDRQIFDVAVDISGYSARETLHVGDDPRADVDGARRAGMRTAWVNRPASNWPTKLDSPDAEVRRIDELLPLMARHRQ
jgi:2-haloalkanoic acid dehalogenase type II